MSWSDYTDYLIGERLGPKSRARYLRWVRDADEWVLKHGASLRTVNATLIAQWAEERVTNSHACRGQAAAALKHFWYMVDHPRPPLRAVDVPPAPEMVCRAIDDDQIDRLIKVASGWWPHGTAVLMGLYLALRRTEIARAEWDRFSPDGDWYTCHGKFDKTRVLPVHPILKGELEEWVGNGWMFTGRWGGPSHPNTIWQWTKEVARVAGIADLRTHQLRHTALAQANDVTGNLRSVQSFAGHSKVSTTAGYTRTTKTRLREVSDALDYL